VTNTIYAFAAFGALCLLAFLAGGVLVAVAYVRDARQNSRAIDREHEEMSRGDRP
jgi:hypothetical protein